MRIAVTGGIGSGKSFVCHLLEQRGISIFYCDPEAKRIIATHPAVQRELLALVGSDVYLETAEDKKITAGNVAVTSSPSAPASPVSVRTLTINKPALGAFIRTSQENAQKVNAIVHPRVAEAFLEGDKNWMECAILSESGFSHLIDKVVVVTCPLEERIQRVIRRDHCTRETALRWISLQMSDEERLKLADFHIVNDGKTPLEPQIDALLAALN